MRWMDYLSRFDFDITYVKGENNKVADCLSRYYENDTGDDAHREEEYVHADMRIDPTGEDLPPDRFVEVHENVVEICAMKEDSRRRSQRLQEKLELRDVEAEEMKEADGSHAGSVSTNNASTKEITIGDMLASGPNLELDALEDDPFLESVRAGYKADPLFKVVLESPEEYKQFFVRDGLIITRTRDGSEVTCVSRTKHGDESIPGIILGEAHKALGHYGFQRTSEYTRRWYWWPRMVSDAKEFCKTCAECQRCKGVNTKPSGKLHSLPIPVKPWDSIGMDFIGPFPEVSDTDGRKFNYLWVIVCRMTSMAHLVPVHTTMTARNLSVVYMREIVRLHGLPSSIVSDRDSKFTSKWWRELHRILDARLLMSTSFHPQTDGLTERMNRSIGQIFRAGLRPDQKDWLGRVDPTEFAINASISDTTRYAPFELNGGYLPSMIREIRDPAMAPPGVRKFAETALYNLADAHDSIIESRVFQTYHANKKRGDELHISAGDLVYLSTKNLSMPKGRARKLCPKFVGPYRVKEAFPESSNYTLELPTALQKCQLHSRFHVSLLRPYHTNNDMLFPNRAHPEPYDFGTPDDAEWFVEEIIGHRWTTKKAVELQVRWSLGDTTWEPLTNCDELAALDRYLEVIGVESPRQLPQRLTAGMPRGRRSTRAR